MGCGNSTKAALEPELRQPPLKQLMVGKGKGPASPGRLAGLLLSSARVSWMSSTRAVAFLGLCELERQHWLTCRKVLSLFASLDGVGKPLGRHSGDSAPVPAMVSTLLLYQYPCHLHVLFSFPRTFQLTHWIMRPHNAGSLKAE